MRMALVPLRHLPLGDDSIDTAPIDLQTITPDMSSIDTSGLYSPPILPTPDYYPMAVPPDISAPSPDFYVGIGPAAPGEVVSSPVDLPGMILAGQLPPPSGGPLSPSQVDVLRNAGANTSDIQSILAGQSTFSKTLSAIQSLAQTGVQVYKALPSSPTPGRPTPVTMATGPAAPGTTSVASPLTWFSQSSVVPGVPNWALAIGAVVGVAALSSAMGGRRR